MYQLKIFFKTLKYFHSGRKKNVYAESEDIFFLKLKVNFTGIIAQISK
jgi:hypothetical protein